MVTHASELRSSVKQESIAELGVRHRWRGIMANFIDQKYNSTSEMTICCGYTINDSRKLHVTSLVAH